MPKILMVDDEQNIVELVKFNLVKEGWMIDTAYDGRSALAKAVNNRPDLIVLDVMLPEMDGFEVCRRLLANKETATIPIIMLSARSEEMDRVIGLELGADDYMTKPFSPRELIARIKARLRRKANDPSGAAPKKNPLFRSGHISIDTEKFEITVNNKKQDFTLKEFELLKLLVSNKGKVFTREYLLETIWGYEYSHDTRTVDVHIRHLRQKIEEDPNEPKYIQTIRGVGYKFKEQN